MSLALVAFPSEAFDAFRIWQNGEICLSALSHQENALTQSLILQGWICLNVYFLFSPFRRHLHIHFSRRGLEPRRMTSASLNERPTVMALSSSSAQQAWRVKLAATLTE